VRLLALDYLAFNATRKPFRRTDVRRAFAAVWTPAFVSHALNVSAFPADGFLPASLDVRAPLWKPSHSPAAYLAAARYPKGRGFPQVTLILPEDAGLHALALELRRAWQRYLGVDVAIRQLNVSNYGRVLNARAYDLAFVRWGADYADPQDFLDTQLGPSPNNVTGWAGSAYDRLIPLADSYNPLDPRRLSLFRQAAMIARDKIPLLPMDEPAQTALIRPGLEGVALTPLGTVYAAPTKLHFTK
jgi:ABC-type oligopeptide transport system substrate-binding subunit